MTEGNATPDPFGPRRLAIELTNICNLHCSYCLRDEDALYHTTANFLSPEFLQQTIVGAREAMAITHVSFTGGEPTLHPQFDRILDVAAENNLTVSFVTNGWRIERIWPTLLSHKNSIGRIGFSLDGITRESHDHWRGEGSFVRIVKGFSLCHAQGIPFSVKIALRPDTIVNLEQIAMFSARMGAAALTFAHIMPTSDSMPDASMLTLEQRREAEREISELAKIFRMEIGVSVGYYNVDVAAPCSPLAGASANIDYRGRLSLCCNLSGFRGQVGEGDVVADLNTESFAAAYPRLRQVAENQLSERHRILTSLSERGEAADLFAASPCLMCLDSFGKLPWRKTLPEVVENRSLPILQGV